MLVELVVQRGEVDARLAAAPAEEREVDVAAAVLPLGADPDERGACWAVGCAFR